MALPTAPTTSISASFIAELEKYGTVGRFYGFGRKYIKCEVDVQAFINALVPGLTSALTRALLEPPKGAGRKEWAEHLARAIVC